MPPRYLLAGTVSRLSAPLPKSGQKTARGKRPAALGRILQGEQTRLHSSGTAKHIRVWPFRDRSRCIFHEAGSHVLHVSRASLTVSCESAAEKASKRPNHVDARLDNADLRRAALDQLPLVQSDQSLFRLLVLDDDIVRQAFCGNPNPSSLNNMNSDFCLLGDDREALLALLLEVFAHQRGDACCFVKLLICMPRFRQLWKSGTEKPSTETSVRIRHTGQSSPLLA